MKDKTVLSIPFRLRRRLRSLGRRRVGAVFACLAGMGTPPSCVIDTAAATRRLARFSGYAGIGAAGAEQWMVGETQDRILQEADKICSGRFELLGGRTTFLDGRMDWHLDFKSGHRWDSSVPHWQASRARPAGADVKVPWELSRFQHVVPLGLAHRLTGDRMYVRTYIEHIESWLAANAVGYGVNWACAMEVALRAVSWLIGASLFHDVLLVGMEHESFRRRLSVSLWQHGIHIARNLEWNGPWSGWRANHFLANLTGLFALGLFFRDTRRGRSWERFSAKWLDREIQRQVTDDGAHFEGSVAYHRLAMEMFLWCRTVGRRAGHNFGRAYSDRLDAMARFVSAYLKPNGDAPLLGDNDDGRLVTSRLHAPADHGYLLPGSGSRDDPVSVDRLLLTGEAVCGHGADDGALSFPQGGFWFVRGGDCYCCMRAGPLAHKGGHAHCDQLSFVLSIGCEDIFCDHGSCTYSADIKKRNLFRGTRYHNTVSVNGAEQNRYGADFAQLFAMADDTKTKILTWHASDGCARLTAEHYGFCRLSPPVVHRREFRLDTTERQLTILDDVLPISDAGEIDWYFHLAPSVRIRKEADHVALTSGDVTVTMTWHAETELAILDVTHSPSYGVEAPAECLHFRYVKAGRAHAEQKPFVFHLQWNRCE